MNRLRIVAMFMVILFVLPNITVSSETLVGQGTVNSIAGHVALSPSSRVFSLKGDGKRFVYLETDIADENNPEFFIASYDYYGTRAFDLDNAYVENNGTNNIRFYTVFDPTRPNNIAHFLNNDFLINGNGGNNLPQGIIDYVNMNRVWWTEPAPVVGLINEQYSVVAGISLLSHTEWRKYLSEGKLGAEDNLPNPLPTAYMLRTAWNAFSTTAGRENDAQLLRAIPQTAPLTGWDKSRNTLPTDASSALRPVFYLTKDFFDNVVLDTSTLGQELKNIIKQYADYEKLSELYTQAELTDIFGTVTPPVAENVTVTGIPFENKMLTASYSYSQAQNMKEYGTEFMWEKSADDITYTQIQGETEQTYTVAGGVDEKYIRVSVTPKTLTSAGVKVTSNPVEVVEPQPPAAKDVFIQGAPLVGETLTGQYTFEAVTDGDELGSTYRWLESDSLNGVFTSISGATGRTFTVTSAYMGKYLKFEVVPKSDGTIQQGIAVQSSPFGVIVDTDAMRQIIDILNNATDEDVMKLALANNDVYVMNLYGDYAKLRNKEIVFLSLVNRNFKNVQEIQERFNEAVAAQAVVENIEDTINNKSAVEVEQFLKSNLSLFDSRLTLNNARLVALGLIDARPYQDINAIKSDVTRIIEYINTPLASANLSSQARITTPIGGYLLTSPASNLFKVKGDTKTFVYLDTDVKNSLNPEFLILTYDYYGTKKFDSEFHSNSGNTSDNYNKFNPERVSNIGYFLNNDFLVNGNGGAKFPSGIIEHINMLRKWSTEPAVPDSAANEEYSFMAGVTVLSQTEWKKYASIGAFGLQDGAVDIEPKPWGFWLRTGVNTRNSSNLSTMLASGLVPNADQRFGCTYNTNATSESPLIRPAFYLKKTFFESVALDVSSMGSNIKNLIKTYADPQKLILIYSQDELMRIFGESSAPTIEGLKIDGNFYPTKQISASYIFKQADNQKESGTTYKWYISDTVNGTYSQIQGAESKLYTVNMQDENKYIKVEVTPSVITRQGSAVMSNPVKINAPVKPKAENIMITGILGAGNVLTADYDFYSISMDNEYGSKYRWLISGSVDGAYTALAGAVGFKYTIKQSDIGKYIKFEVTPKSDGVLNTGEPATSAVTSPVLTDNEIQGKISLIKSAASAALQSVIMQHGQFLNLNFNGDYNLLRNKAEVFTLMHASGDLSTPQKVIASFEAMVLKQKEIEEIEDSVNSATNQNIKAILLENAQYFDTRISGLSNINLNLVCIAVLEGKPYGNITAIQNLIKNKIDDLLKTTQSQDSTSGSSGGGGGGGGGVALPDIGALPQPIDLEQPIVNTNIFDDLESFEWVAPMIEYLAEHNVVNGIGGNKFAPNDSVTREQFAKMIVSVLGMYNASLDADFDDVNKSEWYYTYVASAQANGLINGIGDNKFGIGQIMTRQDMAVTVYRAVKTADLTLGDSGAQMDFEDAEYISDYAEDGVAALYKAGIVTGMPGNVFEPRELLNRAQAAKIIYEVAMLKGGV